ncbi:hypothetical protein EV215_0319 [Hypnocyclicus thermotrophus]|uniref:HEAT repeat protein n=1 Tax=Hypnocyclicus thermotrophus TaxID=1627895 RepID=A0AA46E0H0_9FUSO|nr:hypothetical protein [Hypnocyclicus thermotrophus]TDT72509.1 hypothetical protein EV215_0319 [Hypnocyclicus thermotrophus]
MDELFELYKISTKEQKLDLIDEFFKRKNYLEYIDRLFELLENEKELIIREKIVFSLKKYNTIEIVQQILKFYDSNDVYLRNIAIDIVTSYYELPLQNLLKMLNSENKHIRKLALDTLFNTRNPMMASFIMESLINETDINNKITAVEYLGKLNAKRYADDIVNLLDKEDNEFFTVTVIEALNYIGNDYCYKKLSEKFNDIENVSIIILKPLIKFCAKFIKKDMIYKLKKLKKHYKFLAKEIIFALNSAFQNLTEDEIFEIEKDIYNILKELLELKLSDIIYYEVLTLLSLYDNEEVENIAKKYLYEKEGIIRYKSAEILIEKNQIKYIEDVKKSLNYEKDQTIRERLRELIKGE